MKQVLIRNMAEGDLESVVRIERVSFSFPWSETSFRNELYKPRSIAKVAVIGDTVTGYICADCVADEGHILNLAVHPDYRRTGVATILVENILGELRLKGCRFLYLEVRISNYAAERLYKSFGFKVAGTRKKYYVAPIEDAVIMMLEL